ncbi:MAG: glycosyltransferase [Patescibacteria group bacterium]
MKVLIIAATPYFSNRGCHIRIFQQAEGLYNKKVDVLLCTYNLGKNVGSFSIKTPGKTSWYKKTSPGFAWGKIWLDLKLLKLCVREIKRFNPDIIHSHLFEGFAVGLLAKFLSFKFKLPIIIDSQGDLNSEFDSYNSNQKIAKKIFVWFSKRIINFADYVVLSSENSLYFFNRFSFLKNKISVIKDGVDLALYKHPKDFFSKESAKKELKEIRLWKRNKKILIYSGGMNDSKGVFDLIKAFAGLKSFAKKRWALLLYGKGEDRKKYKRFVSDNNLQNCIKFARESSFLELPGFLSMSDAAIEPKKESTEGSAKLVNYMAAKLPIICFDNNFNRNRLGNKGFYINNIADLESVLIRKDLKQEEYDLEKESQEAEIKKLLNVYKNILKRKQ